MADTIFYSMKLKAGKTPAMVFERIQKKVGTKGASANWSVTVSEQSLVLDLGDGASEPFRLDFEGKKASGSCRVAFPTEGELFENEKKSEWKTLIALLHSVKPLCAAITVTDDAGLAAEYFQSLDYPFTIRCLTPEEEARTARLIQSGYTDHERFLLQIFAEDTQRGDLVNWQDAIHPYTKLCDPFPQISALWETYLYKTSTLKNRCLREIYGNDIRFEGGVKHVWGDPPAEVYTFCLGVGMLFSAYDFIDNTWGRGVHVTRYYRDKFLPVFAGADDAEKCRLAYRFMLSVYEYCKFRFAGKDGIDGMIAAYEKGAIHSQ